MKLRTIRTRRLEIRALKARDYAAWYEAEALSLPKQNPFDHPPLKKGKATRRHFKNVLKRHRARAKADQCYIVGAFERKSGRLVGMMDVAILHRRRVQKGNLGYRVFNRHWRKGFGAEMVRALIPVALQELKLNRLEAVISLGNRASMRLVKSVGMKREGIRLQYYFVNGRWEDSVVFTAIRRDWGIGALKVKM